MNEQLKNDKYMADICNDDRFEIIKRFKQRLIEGTNIETSPKEMEVIDSILYRFWQMGWLTLIDKFTIGKGTEDDVDECNRIIAVLTEQVADCKKPEFIQQLSNAHTAFIRFRDSLLNKPIFKVGDKVRSISDESLPPIVIEDIDETCYYGDTTNFDIADQNDYELVYRAGMIIRNNIPSKASH